MKSLPRSAFLLIAALGLAHPASAHPVPFSYLDLHLRGSAIEGTLVAHIADLAHDLKIEPAERLLDPSVASTHSRTMGEMLSRRLVISGDDHPLALEFAEAEVAADRQSLRFRFRARAAAAPGRIS
ncbi:MAG TPA: hypothetical protein PLD86_14115, partial [Vicinamibacteria bacterium]|nr:hypothetical protein [Vicinamibacteria bacterium]